MAVDTIPLLSGSAPFYVYVYHDPRRGKRHAPIYVGKGTAALGRADIHWKGRSQSPLLRKILYKIRAAGLEPLIEIVGWFDDEDAAFALERALIKRFGRRDLDLGTLCNLTDGGEGQLGKVVSAETRKKLSEAGKGRQFSPETIARIAASNRGQKRSAETRQRLKETHAGQTRSPETIAKFVAAMGAKKDAGWRKPRTSEESKDKYRATMRARREAGMKRSRRPPTAETIAKALATKRANGTLAFPAVSAEARERGAAKRRGKKMSPESRERMRRSRLAYLERQRAAKDETSPA